ncbi:hypothetical protein [Halomarina oriensis]|uniref:Uncharacterized protein n=1 Tax=Halomarina oriensis TaxID=671145 RepID=A0A6B0GKI9_9EURY|nr:hypothetical protein [Halomarina oriensis]MWG35446.1 hypothetical protein [Halomarina oriensis]
MTGPHERLRYATTRTAGVVAVTAGYVHWREIPKPALGVFAGLFAVGVLDAIKRLFDWAYARRDDPAAGVELPVLGVDSVYGLSCGTHLLLPLLVGGVLLVFGGFWVVAVDGDAGTERAPDAEAEPAVE